MSGTTMPSRNDADNDRWRQWQLDYETSSRRGMRHARIVFGIAITAAVLWLGLRALAWSV